MSSRVAAPLSLALALAAAISATAEAANLETQLNARWRGASVLILAPASSQCDGFYNDNDARGREISGRGAERFPEGELARVERIDVKRNRIDAFLDLAEPVLEPRRDGPFTLYDTRLCKIQLKIQFAGDTLEAAEAALGALLRNHRSDAEAKNSPRFNRRRRADLPPDYDRTLADYRAWKAATVNAAIRQRMDEAIADLARIAQRATSNEDYALGFAAGLEKLKYRSYSDCGSLLGSGFYPDSAGGKSGDYRRGYEDGQRVGYAIGLLDRLRGCFVPVPAAAGDGG